MITLVLMRFAPAIHTQLASLRFQSTRTKIETSSGRKERVVNWEIRLKFRGKIDILSVFTSWRFLVTRVGKDDTLRASEQVYMNVTQLSGKGLKFQPMRSEKALFSRF